LIKIILNPGVEIKGTVLLEGFPGAGLVGPMAISYIIDKIGMECIGHIESPDFPPLIAVHNDKPMPPVRIYLSKKTNIIAIFAEFAIPIEITYEISDAIYEFAKEKGIAEIMSISGIPYKAADMQKEQASFFIASNENMRAKAVKAGLKSVGEGVATGVNAMIMMRAVSNGIPDLSILVPVDPNIVDPKYAELAIIALNKVIGLNVDTTELNKEAALVESKISDILKKNKETQDAHKRAIGGETGQGPSMYG
jgi:uncharacterized protein